MYGWRGRLGVILGRPNAVCEPEFNKMVPDGVSIHGARMGNASIHDYGSQEAMEEHEKLVAELSDALTGIKPNIIIFAHTAASMGNHPDYNLKLTEIMETTTGLKALTSATAIIDSLRAVGAKRIGLAVPFPPKPDLATQVKNFLEHPAVGFEVVNISAVHGDNPVFITNMTPDVAYRFGKKADHANAEAILLAGTPWRTIEAIEPLEQDLQKPVISANQAVVWAALRQIGVNDGGQGYGSLFNH